MISFCVYKASSEILSVVKRHFVNRQSIAIETKVNTHLSRKMSQDAAWRGVPLTQIYGAATPWGAPEFPLVEPSSRHTVLFQLPLDQALVPAPPTPRRGRDAWDQFHVRLPCSKKSLYPIEDESGDIQLKNRWGLIVSALSKPIRNSQELMDAILSYNSKFKDRWKFRVLHKLFNRYLDERESKHFFDVTLPKVAKLALDLPNLIQSPIPLLKQHKNHSLSLSQQQIACLLANAFFCTFPRRNSPKRDSEYSTYPPINFSRMYESSASKSVMEKMKCICYYFRRVTTKMPTGVVTFCRRSVPPEQCPDWANSTKLISAIPLHADSDGLIENAHGLIQVDFANRFLGGGVIGQGCVQEEIRFIICPELIASMVFTQELKATEAVMIIGAEQYSGYSGYGSGFEWEGAAESGGGRAPRDGSGRPRVAVLALDALAYGRDARLQYAPHNVLRDLNKAWVGFSFFTEGQAGRDGQAGRAGLRLPGVATGNWGCGVYRGSPHLKSLLQLLACAQAATPMAYYTFKDAGLRDDIVNVYNLLCTFDVTVGQLYKHILDYCGGERTQDLHSYLEQTLKQQSGLISLFDSEPMDVSACSQTTEPSVSTARETDNRSPDLFSSDASEPTASSQADTQNSVHTVTSKQGSGQLASGYCKTLRTDSITSEGSLSSLYDDKIVLSDDTAELDNKIVNTDSKMADTEHKMAANNHKMAGSDDEIGGEIVLDDEIPSGDKKIARTDDKPAVSHTSRLFDEMQKLDASNGTLNLNTRNSFLSDNKTDSNEIKIQMDLSAETKKKLTSKITDYFSKKPT